MFVCRAHHSRVSQLPLRGLFALLSGVIAVCVIWSGFPAGRYPSFIPFTELAH